ncbi:Protein deltex-3 [Chelonia mydas]|uniref:E3 ubiquitin-protein ligase n=1 Tax=Chelonia mydas TaxID=8469 RepID=M7C1Q2_CHEMY|nr:Protein deltex-3 [Chelonia mydas]
MAACGGATKNKLTVSKPVWDFLTKEAHSKLVRLKEETKLSILIDGETSEIYVLQLSTPAPGAGNGLYLARKALKALLKETEKELKKAQRQSELNVKTLEKCKHSFCEDCITRALQVKRACPMCGRFYGQLVGNQPENGRMLVSKDSSLLLPGYEKYGTIIIHPMCSVPTRLRWPLDAPPFPVPPPDLLICPPLWGHLVEHPNPGVRYPGTTRVAYLPDCPEGNKVLALFRKAFDQRLTFTIGTSMTTGRANVITWNDIHHKTNCTGGPQL